MNPPQPTKTLKVDHLPVKIYKDADSLGKAAALEARRIIQEAIDERKKANIILATGNSQLNFLESLRNLEDIEWWNATYSKRYKILEKFLPENSRDILDIGSGPGYFLLKGTERGWNVKGIEPSNKAYEHSKNLNLNVEQCFYTEKTAPSLGLFDVINLSSLSQNNIGNGRLSSASASCLY